MKKVVLFTIIFLSILLIQINYYAHCETISLSKVQMKVLFSPQDNCAQEIVSAIDKAEQYVFVAMYFFTSRPIAQALIRSQDRGVEVKICLDDEQPHYEYSKSRYLENKDINIRLIGGSGIMHNKFCIIDDRITITGSYNLTARADLENDENILIIEPEEMARVYKEQFLKYWQGSYVDTCVYKDENRLEKTHVSKGYTVPETEAVTGNKYVGSINSDIFHYPNCKWAKKIKEENNIWFESRKEALDNRYTPCKVCTP
ncbi:Cardiolipin synthase [subsurface metagenome]